VVDAAGRPFPVLGPAHRVAVIDLLDVGRVLDDEAGRADELVEAVVAGAVPPRTPFDAVARVMRPPPRITDSRSGMTKAMWFRQSLSASASAMLWWSPRGWVGIRMKAMTRVRSDSFMPRAFS
jgi:hypothetical protein